MTNVDKIHLADGRVVEVEVNAYTFDRLNGSAYVPAPGETTENLENGLETGYVAELTRDSVDEDWKEIE